MSGPASFERSNPSRGPRVLFAGLFHETHGFLDETTPIEAFAIHRGETLLGLSGDASPMGGALTRALELGWEVLPVADYRATPSGVVEDAVWDAFWADWVSCWDSQAPPDAIFLVLHGAMMTRSRGDIEGDLIRRIRTFPGAACIPIFGVFDLHANVSPAMASAEALLAYRENPHRDARDAAIRAVDLLQRSLTTGERPVMVHRSTRFLWAPIHTGTVQDPMRSLLQRAREIEREDPSVWAVNVNSGFAYADTPDTGLSFQVVHDAAITDGSRYLDQLEALARELDAVPRDGLLSPEEALHLLSEPCEGLTLLVEPSDNIGAGAPGDATGGLRLLLEAGVAPAAVAIYDPETVEHLRGVSVGERTRVEIGGKLGRFDRGPVSLSVELLGKSNGRFELEDERSHMASIYGKRFDMGDCVVVEHAGIRILLTSRRTPPFDLGQWRSQGIEPTSLKVIVVKAAVAHRAVYDPITTRSLVVETEGACSSDISRFYHP